MNTWVWILLIGVVVIAWLVFQRLFITPAGREYDSWLDKCLNKQAQLRGGQVIVRLGRRTLTVPYQNVNIELSFFESSEQPSTDYAYARFKTESFNTKRFSMVLKSSDVFQKPLVVGTRIELADQGLSEKYIATGNDAAFVNGLLNEEVRDRLLQESLQVKFGRRTDSSTLSQEQGWLSVFTKGMNGGDEVFNGMIETAMLFHDRLAELGSRVS